MEWLRGPYSLKNPALEFRTGVGNLFIITGRMNRALSLKGRKIH